MAYARIYQVLGDHLGKDAAKFGATAIDIFKWIEAHGWDANQNTTGWWVRCSVLGRCCTH